jgi:PKHD-type hydroxylase
MRQNWQLWAGVLGDDMCRSLIDECYLTCNMKPATVFNSNNSPDPSIRTTNVGWTDSPRIKSIMEHYTILANRNAFNIDINYMPSTQFTEYTEGAFYDWHYDINWESNLAYDRKLSIVIQLSDPSEYDGGIFEFQEVETPVNFKLRGSILVFPSYLVHRVTKVTRGKRLSLVNWMEGPRWR